MSVSVDFQPSEPQTQRLFFALWPRPELQAQLYGLGGKALGERRGRRIKTENLHLTLAFLGPVSEGARACYERAADGIHAVSFALTFDRMGCFRRTGVLWVGPTQVPAPLLDLVGELNRGLSACGYIPEQRAYRAHLTIARNVRRCPEETAVAPVPWSVHAFSLVQSHMEPHSARYEILRSWDLA